MTIDTATAARALSRTLGGEWRITPLPQEGYLWFETLDEERGRNDPREDTDVCLEMLAALKAQLTISHGEPQWIVRIRGVQASRIPTSGQPFRDAVIRRCAGEE